MLASLGLEKGQPFQSTSTQAEVLKEAAVIGEAMLKSITFDKPFSNNDLYKGTNWDQLYRKAAFTWEAVSRGKAYYIEQAGMGPQYRTAYKDGNGVPLNGAMTYKVTLPAPIPAKDFWSFMVYDNQTCSILETDQVTGGLDSNLKGVKLNDDGSATVYFSPKAPEGQEGNWVQTMPGKGYNAILRLYGHLNHGSIKAGCQATSNQSNSLTNIMP